MIVIKFIGMILSVIFMIGVVIWITRRCWLDSKDDFKMIFTDCINFVKKKKAD